MWSVRNDRRPSRRLGLIVSSSTGLLVMAAVVLLATTHSSAGGSQRTANLSSASASGSATPPACAPNAPLTPRQCASAVASAQQQAAQSWPTSGSAISEAQAIVEARGASTAASYALLTTYGQANRLVHGEATNPYVGSATPVWVVTVHAAPQPNSGIIAVSPAPGVYTVVMDAANGRWIDRISGLDAVTSTVSP
jgi:hypothetical protein